MTDSERMTGDVTLIAGSFTRAHAGFRALQDGLTRLRFAG